MDTGKTRKIHMLRWSKSCKYEASKSYIMQNDEISYSIIWVQTTRSIGDYGLLLIFGLEKYCGSHLLMTVSTPNLFRTRMLKVTSRIE